MNENFVEETMAEVNRRIAAELDELGRDITDDLKRLISVPVGRAGSVLIHSDPGEPPRRDTGGLLESIRYNVASADTGPDLTTLTIFSDSPIAQYLEYGTSRGLARRPFFEPTFEKWTPIVIERISTVVFRVGPLAK